MEDEANTAKSLKERGFPWRDVVNKKLEERLHEKRQRDEALQQRASVAKRIVKKNGEALDKIEVIISSYSNGMDTTQVVADRPIGA